MQVLINWGQYIRVISQTFQELGQGFPWLFLSMEIHLLHPGYRSVSGCLTLHPSSRNPTASERNLKARSRSFCNEPQSFLCTHCCAPCVGFTSTTSEQPQLSIYDLPCSFLQPLEEEEGCRSDLLLSHSASGTAPELIHYLSVPPPSPSPAHAFAHRFLLWGPARHLRFTLRPPVLGGLLSSSLPLPQCVCVHQMSFLLSQSIICFLGHRAVRSHRCFLVFPNHARG